MSKFHQVFFKEPSLGVRLCQKFSLDLSGFILKPFSQFNLNCSAEYKNTLLGNVFANAEQIIDTYLLSFEYRTFKNWHNLTSSRGLSSLVLSNNISYDGHKWRFFTSFNPYKNQIIFWPYHTPLAQYHSRLRL